MKTIKDFLPEQRAEGLISALGWQGGTIHDACREVGIDATDFLYSAPQPFDFEVDQGWFCVRTSPIHFSTSKEREKGNVNFWIGVAQGQYLTIQQKRCGK